MTRCKSKLALHDERMEDVNDSDKEDIPMDRDGAAEMSSADERDGSWDHPGEAVRGHMDNLFGVRPSDGAAAEVHGGSP